MDQLAPRNIQIALANLVTVSQYSNLQTHKICDLVQVSSFDNKVKLLRQILSHFGRPCYADELKQIHVLSIDIDFFQFFDGDMNRKLNGVTLQHEKRFSRDFRVD